MSGKYVINWTRVRELEIEKQRYWEELQEYKSDFQILTDEGFKLAQACVICENNTYLVNCLNSSCLNIESIAGENKVPGFNELFDFSDFQTNGDLSSGFNSANDSFITGINNVGKEIDRAKQEVAEHIADLDSKIFIIRDLIEEVKMNPIWIEDSI